MSFEIKNRQSEIDDSHWWFLTLSVAREAEEAVSSLLFDFGSTGIVTLEEQAETVTLGAYFNVERNTQVIKQSLEDELARTGQPDLPANISISAVPNEDWMQKWKEGFEPIEIGERLVVTPSWKVPDRSTGRIMIQIDPGMAFGTGTHETTRLCLEAIERHWRGGSLLDVGTGTGILAIAATLLAPGSRVVAIDVDPQAVEVALENLAINGVPSSVDLGVGQPLNFAGQEFGVIVANLTAEVIIDLLADLTRSLASDGLMILSGILGELAADVEHALRECGFAVTERRIAGEWCALLTTRTRAGE